MEIGKFGMKAMPPQSWWNVFMWTNPPDSRVAVANNTDACLYLAEQAAMVLCINPNNKTVSHESL